MVVMSFEGSFLFVSFSNPYLMIGIGKVKLGKISSLAKSIQ